MQRDKNLVYINYGVNDGVNGQQIDAIHMGYHQTGAVYTRRSGSVQIQPDRPPIRARIGSNSTINEVNQSAFSLLHRCSSHAIEVKPLKTRCSCWQGCIDTETQTSETHIKHMTYDTHKTTHLISF